MALQDNLVFVHFGNSLTEDFPTTAGTKGNPGTTTDPAVSNGNLVFDSATGQAISYSYGSNIWAPGTGDFTVAVRVNIATSLPGDNALIHFGPDNNFASEFVIRQRPNDNGQLEWVKNYGLNAVSTSPTGYFTVGTESLVCLVREAGEVKWYDGTGTVVSASTTSDGATLNVTSASRVNLGAMAGGNFLLDGEENLVAVWGRALTPTEIQNNINETDLSTAISGGSDTTAPTLSSATVDGTALALTYNESLDTASVPAIGDFTVTGGVSGAITVSAVGVSGTDVNLTLASAADSSETVTLDYTLGTNPIQDTSGNTAVSLTGRAVTNNTSTADTTAPTFTAGPTAANIAETSLDVNATLDEAGTIYSVVFADNATAPTSAEVKAGTGSGGAAAVSSGSIAAAASTQATISHTGLTGGTAYDVYTVAEDDEATPNAQASPTLTNVTTLANPVLTAASGTSTGETTADGSVSTDQSTGTLYWVVTQSTTKPSVAQVQAGQDHTGAAADASGDQAVSATGTQNVSATGLTSGTTYYFHFQHNIPVV